MIGRFVPMVAHIPLMFVNERRANMWNPRVSRPNQSCSRARHGRRSSTARRSEGRDAAQSLSRSSSPREKLVSVERFQEGPF